MSFEAPQLESHQKAKDALLGISLAWWHFASLPDWSSAVAGVLVFVDLSD